MDKKGEIVMSLKYTWWNGCDKLLHGDDPYIEFCRGPNDFYSNHQRAGRFISYTDSRETVRKPPESVSANWGYNFFASGREIRRRRTTPEDLDAWYQQMISRPAPPDEGDFLFTRKFSVLKQVSYHWFIGSWKPKCRFDRETDHSYIIRPNHHA